MHAPLYGYNQTSIVEPTTTTETFSIRTNFITPEGVYRQMTVNEFFRNSRIPNQAAGAGLICNSPVRVSFLRIPTNRLSYAEETLPSTSEIQDNVLKHSHSDVSYIERICFNIGREIYVFDYNSSLTSPSDSAKPVDKRVYKGTFPTCHDFKQIGATLYSCALLVGFSAGQIQLVDPSQKEIGAGSSKLFNEDRLIDKTAVTCLKWVPSENMLFAASHMSGNLYFYNEELASPQLIPNYQVIRQCDDHYMVYGCKAKAERNPICRWTIGKGAINNFKFAGEESNLIAIASQDGYLRIFNWKSMDMIGFFKSYFGGILCLSWSPDLRYIASGGEDDLLTLYSLHENRVVCRGQGHKSWISEVAFDHYASEFASSQQRREYSLDREYSLLQENSTLTPCGFSHAETAQRTSSSSVLSRNGPNPSVSTMSVHNSNNFALLNDESINSSFDLCSNGQPSNSKNTLPNNSEIVSQSQLFYRIGTVGHDCQLCLWDISMDNLLIPLDDVSQRQPEFMFNSPSSCTFSERISPKNTTVIPIGIGNALGLPDNEMVSRQKSSDKNTNSGGSKSSGSRFKKFHKRGLSLGSRLTGNDRWSRQNGCISTGINSADGTLKRGEHFSASLYGTAQCPRLDDVSMIEPLICKKVAHERLGALHFREDYIVTACQEGLICTWARPNVLSRKHDLRMELRDGHHFNPAPDIYDSTCV